MIFYFPLFRMEKDGWEWDKDSASIILQLDLFMTGSDSRNRFQFLPTILEAKDSSEILEVGLPLATETLSRISE
jgi:hypothetical protein